MSVVNKVKWNNYGAAMSASFIGMLTEDKFIDVMLDVDGQLFGAHRLILAMASPLFMELLKDMPNDELPRTFSIKADICQSSRGFDTLYLNGFAFGKQHENRVGITITWACIKRKKHHCKASVSTRVIDGKIMMRVNTAEHTHEL